MITLLPTEGIGGHNPLEPACAGKPVLFGPHMSNFSQIAALLTARHAAFQVETGAALVKKTRELIDSSELRDAAGAAALEVIQNNSGATGKIIAAVQSVLQQG